MTEIIQLARSAPLALYLRPGRSGAAQIRDMIAAHRLPCEGLVLDPALWRRQSDLAGLASGARLDTVLDTRSLELASHGGRERSGIGDLPWFTSPLHTPNYLLDAAHRYEVVSEIARFTVNHGLSSVLAPTHFLLTPDDPWLRVDDLLTNDLRRHLDLTGGNDVRIYRPVYIHSQLLRSRAFLEDLTTRLVSSPVHALWLGVHPFGTSSAGPLAMRRYVDFCLELHRCGRPLIGIHTGTVGVLLMALGALSGIESGITDLETFRIDQFGELPISDGSPAIGSTPRIYIQSLGVFMTQKEARAFFGVRGLSSQHACQTGCCRRGVEDTYRYRINHFVTNRSEEVRRLSRVPAHLRSKHYLDEFLRPACDKAAAASRAVPSLVPARERLDAWRQTMTGILDRYHGNLPTFAPALRLEGDSQRASG